LVTADQLFRELPDMNIIQLEEKVVVLDEGTHHCGKANVVDLIAKKK
jgi:hypothetical protein